MRRGFLKYRTTQASVSPVIRGLLGRQILILIDGVKVNNALFGDTPNMDLIDVSMIERIEIVRGVVSVLGTESLGGVVNIITKKAEGREKIGGTVGLRYSTNGSSWATPLSVHGTTEKFRWIAWLRKKRSVKRRGARGSACNASPTIRNARQASAPTTSSRTRRRSASAITAASRWTSSRPAGMISGVSLLTEITPSRLQLGNVSYQDLTDRKLFQSLRVTGYLNVQDTGTSDVRAKTPSLESVIKEERPDDRAQRGARLVHRLAPSGLGRRPSRDTITSFARDTDRPRTPPCSSAAALPMMPATRRPASICRTSSTSPSGPP